MRQTIPLPMSNAGCFGGGSVFQAMIRPSPALHGFMPDNAYGAMPPGSSNPMYGNIGVQLGRLGGNFGSRMPLLNAPAYDNLTSKGKPKDYKVGGQAVWYDTFHGTHDKLKALLFLQQFDAAFAGGNFTEFSKIRKAATFPKTNALQWWTTLLNQGVVPSTWVQFKQIFAPAWITNTFEVDVMTAWNQLSAINCESLEEYNAKLWDALLPVSSFKMVPLAKQIKKYCCGLPKGIKNCGFGLLMYGFGSKKALLENFASSALVDGAAIVVNGYLPTINLKTVVFTIADAMWEQRKASLKSAKSAGGRPLVTQSVDELIASLHDKEENSFVYVIVHNIDGPCLRDADTQQVLANLAGSSNVRLVASMDHINTPLLWDKRTSTTKFNWCWHNTPTYAPYAAETMNLPLILVSSGSAKSARSALLVLQSLTPNAQSVFRILADYQLNHSEELGLSVHKLYTLCRERFLVSSELTLRSHLTEFKDHELVKSRRGLDGQDCLFIPLPLDTIAKLLDQVGG
ncbi:hypothetical protein L7F22_005515 [Adiantum nelumboides]|nr:hypothetical protein [Adiantum nelumboides]